METTVIATPPPMTFEQAMALMEKRNEATFAKIEADRLDTLAKIEEDKKIHAEQMKKMHQDTLAKIEADRLDTLAKIEAQKKEDNKKWREMSLRLGEIIEYMIAPDLPAKFRELGFTFKNSTIRQDVSDGTRILTDIDILLEDGDSVMLIEAKTCPTVYDVKEHLKNMKIVQQHPPRSVIGAKIYGAIAGAVVKDNVVKAAFDAGFYVVMQTGDNVEIVQPPKDFVPKIWEAKPSQKN
jgi:hypothetical protein